MKTYISEDRLVTKYSHDDGSETCIKTVPSLDVNTVGEAGVTYDVVDRNKYSVFLSDSCGCPLNCSFCYLSIDEVPYKKLLVSDIMLNVVDALEARVRMEPTIKDRYIKLCWMGMGEAIIKPARMAALTMDILNFAISTHGYARGLDGVDISTVLPWINDQWMDDVIALNHVLTSSFKLNPSNRKADNVAPGSTLVSYTDRSVFRMFYSLHSAVQETRDFIIPNAMDLSNAEPRLRVMQENGVDVIFHHMFLEGINDTEEEVRAVINWMKRFPGAELRILRYNKHEDSSIRESDAFEQCMCMLGGEVEKIKVQVSQGDDVKSACGQFVYNNEHRVEQYAKLDAIE